jgi:hypothetical protein
LLAIGVDIAIKATQESVRQDSPPGGGALAVEVVDDVGEELSHMAALAAFGHAVGDDPDIETVSSLPGHPPPDATDGADAADDAGDKDNDSVPEGETEWMEEGSEG